MKARRKRFPPDFDVNQAIEWLRVNEGEDGEADACQAVADWLEAELFDRQVRSIARRDGVSVSFIRRCMDAVSVKAARERERA